MGNLSGESREQNRKDKVTRFRSVTYARQLGLLVNTLGSHLKLSNRIPNSPLYYVDCKTVRIFAYPSTRKQSTKGLERNWGETLKMRTVRFAYVIFVRITHFSQPRAIPIGYQGVRR